MASFTPAIGLISLLVAGAVIPSNIPVIIICGLFYKFGSGLTLGATTVMLADVIDYGEVKLGTRNESIVASFQTLLVKTASAVAGWLIGCLLYTSPVDFADKGTADRPAGQHLSAGTFQGHKVESVLQDGQCFVPGAIVDNHNFKLRIVLPQQRPNGLHNGQLLIIGRDQHRNRFQCLLRQIQICGYNPHFARDPYK